MQSGRRGTITRTDATTPKSATRARVRKSVFLRIRNSPVEKNEKHHNKRLNRMSENRNAGIVSPRADTKHRPSAYAKHRKSHGSGERKPQQQRKLPVFLATRLHQRHEIPHLVISAATIQHHQRFSFNHINDVVLKTDVPFPNIDAMQRQPIRLRIESVPEKGTANKRREKNGYHAS